MIGLEHVGEIERLDEVPPQRRHERAEFRVRRVDDLAHGRLGLDLVQDLGEALRRRRRAGVEAQYEFAGEA